MRFRLLVLRGHSPPLPCLASPVLARATKRGAGQEAANLELVTGFHEGVSPITRWKRAHPSSPTTSSSTTRKPPPTKTACSEVFWFSPAADLADGVDAAT